MNEKIKEFIESYCFWLPENSLLEKYFNKEEFCLNMIIKFFIENDNINKLVNETEDFEQAGKIVSKLDLFIQSW